MHVRKGAWRWILGVLALVAFTIALPLAQSVVAVPVANAQTSTPQGVNFATSPDSIARGGGQCLSTPKYDSSGEYYLSGGPSDPNCYVSATTDETGVIIDNVSYDPLGVPHKFIFTCGAATGADLTGTGATDVTPAPAPGCYDVQVKVDNESAGTAASIVNAKCGYNTATVTGSTANCNAEQSPLCATVPGAGVPDGDSDGDLPDNADIPNPPGTNQGMITGATDASLCTTTDITPPLGQQMEVTINPGSPNAFLLTWTGYTLPCGPNTAVDQGTVGGASKHGDSAKPKTYSHPIKTDTGVRQKQADPGTADNPQPLVNPAPTNVYNGSTNTQCSSVFDSTIPPDTSCPPNPTGTGAACEPGVVCPTGMTYVPGGSAGFDVTTSLAVPPFEGTLPIIEGVCQFQVQVEKKYIELNKLTIGCYQPPTSSTLTTTPTGTLLYSEGLKAFFGPLCLLNAVATGIVILKTTDCGQETSLIGHTAPFPGISSTSPATYQCVNNVLEVVGVVPDIPVPITYTVSGPGGLSNVVPGPTLVNQGGNLCAANSENTHSTAPGEAAGTASGVTFSGIVTFPTYLCPTGPGSGTVQACFASSIDTQGAGCSNYINFTYNLPNGQRVVPYIRWAGEKQVLTKCFGGAGLMAGAPVEFTLDQGNGATAGAALIPASVPSDASGTGVGTFGGGTAVQASQDTVWTITDVDGCASVILFASGEGQVVVDASIYSVSPISNEPGFFDSCVNSACGAAPLINEHAFEVFYLKFDHLDIENIAQTAYATSSLNGLLNFGTSAPPGYCNPSQTCAFSVSGLKTSTGATIVNLLSTFNAVQGGASSAFPNCPSTSFCLPNPPGTNAQPAGGYPIPLCQVDYVRAMVHGYFEMPGDPSGRPATNVSLTGSPTGAAGSYVLPAGRWVLPEDWPVLATFAGFNAGSPLDVTPNSVMSWDLNSGWVFNPTGEKPVLCEGLGVGTTNSTTTVIQPPAANTSGVSNTGAALAGGAIPNGDNDEYSGQVSYGPCYGTDAGGQTYATGGSGPASLPADNLCGDAFVGQLDGVTVGIGPYDISQQCTDSSGPLTYKPAGSTVVGGPLPPSFSFNGETEFGLFQLTGNSTYLPNGTLNQWDAPMPAAQISFTVNGSGPGFLNQVNKTGLYGIPTVGGESAIYPDPFYATMIPASPMIPAIANNGGYWWNSWGSTGGSTVGATTGEAFVAGESTGPFTSFAGFCPAGTTSLQATGGSAACFIDNGVGGAASVTQPQCATIGGTFVPNGGTDGGTGLPTGTCSVPPAEASLPGGVNLTNFGPGCTTVPSSASTVVVADGTGFVAGQTVLVYSNVNGQVLVAGLRLTSVTSGPFPYGGTTAATLHFDPTSIPPHLCILAFQGTFTSEQTAIPVSASDITSGSLQDGTEIDLTEPASEAVNGATTTASTTVEHIGSCPLFDGLAGMDCIWVNGSAALARELGGCLMSRGPLGGPFTPGACEPGDDYLGVGTLVSVGPQQFAVPPGRYDLAFGEGSDFSIFNPSSSVGDGPYPFWQWLQNAPTATSRARNATVYSDNHGEAVVSFETGILSSLAPSTSISTNGGCPTGYSPVPSAAAATSCLLNFGALGSAATTPGGVPFPAISAAQAAFSATNPGCGTFTVNATTGVGTFTPAPSSTPTTSGAPADGQICVNNLGGIDFGKNAVLGTSNIQAVADYPYFKLHPAISTLPNGITKVFTSGFAKSVTVTPGTPCNPSTAAASTCGIAGPAGTTTFTVTITATDICGNPIVGEPVDIFALGNAGAVVLAPGSTNVTPTSTSTATAVTDANGKVVLTLEVLNTAIGTQGLVVKVVFPRESLERFATVIPGTLPNQTFTALYGAGYNQIGGPPGSNFSSAEAVYVYNPSTQTYSAVTSSDANLSSAAPGCTGYWAYFAAITAVSLPANSTSGATAACTLAAGWNLVGNPFATPARLPATVTAYHYDPVTATYSVVGAIPAGGAVWIFNDGTLNTLTLTAT